MKRIVICFDGTWSKPADEALPADGRVETKVCRFYASIKDKAADGSKLEGTLVRQNDFLVVLTLADGTRKSMARVDGVPKVDVRDPEAGHKATILKLAFEDSDNSIMHNITAYLATLK